MRPNRLERIKEALDEVLALPPAERPSLLDEICDGDSALREEVESLLAFEDTEQPWQEGPIVSLLDTSAALQVGQRIGPYRVVRGLGEGGMGAVALAVREDDFEKQVAIKVIPQYRMSPEMIRRFHNERQLLAQLEHPNIARILDGGTTDEGQPYFVMEYVEGERIDAWCKRQELPIRDRLELFLQVASAIQLAHRNLVVHRDLKPGNILVASDGIPKLLDFGIAKSLVDEEDEQVTRVTQRPMTLRYASPEQVAGRPMTTASDIYSLGLLLYQLLTGRYAYASEGDSDLDVAQAIRDHEPRRPSMAAAEQQPQARPLARDLDSIILKAMRKEPDRRYVSVEQLAEDIQRFLTGRPVLARKGNWSYRAGKYIRRHRWQLAAVALIVGLSLAYGVTTTVLLQRAVLARENAELARQEAVSEQKRSQEVLQFMKGLFRASDPNQSRGEQLTAPEILARGEQRLERVQDPSHRAELWATLGETYLQLGAVDRAGQCWQRAEKLLRQHYPGGHRELAKAVNNLAGGWYHGGDFDEAERLYREALAMKMDLDEDTAKSKSNLATILMSRGDLVEAERLYREALLLRERQEGPESLVTATAYRSLGNLHYVSGAFQDAEPQLRKALAILQALQQPRPLLTAATLSSLGRVHHAQGQLDEAEQLYTEALELRQHTLGRVSKDHLHIAASQLDLARLYLDQGRPEEGWQLLDMSLATLREKKSPDAWEIAQAESVLGDYLARNGDQTEAEELLRQSYRRLVEVRGESSIYARNALARLERFREAS